MACAILLLLLFTAHTTASILQETDLEAVPLLFPASTTTPGTKGRRPSSALRDRRSTLSDKVMQNLRRRHSEDYTTLLPRAGGNNKRKVSAAGLVKQNNPVRRAHSPNRRAEMRILSGFPVQQDDHFFSQVPKKRPRLGRSELGTWARGNEADAALAAAVKDDSGSKHKQDERLTSPVSSTASQNRGPTVRPPTRTRQVKPASQGQSRSNPSAGISPDSMQLPTIKSPYRQGTYTQARPFLAPLPSSGGVLATTGTGGATANRELGNASQRTSAVSRDSPQANLRGSHSLHSRPMSTTVSNTQSTEGQNMSGPTPMGYVQNQLTEPSARQILQDLSDFNAPSRQPARNRSPSRTSSRQGAEGRSLSNIGPGPFMSWLDMVTEAAQLHTFTDPQVQQQARVPAARFPSSVPQADRLNRLIEAADAKRFQRNWDYSSSSDQ